MKINVLLICLCLLFPAVFPSSSALNAKSFSNTPTLYSGIRYSQLANDVEQVEEPNYAISLPGGTNGANSNVAIPPLNIISLPVTIEMWYKPATTQRLYATLLYNRGTTNNSGIQYDRWTDQTKIKGVWNGAAELPTNKPAAGKWNHIALVITATSKTLYINGTPFTESVASFSNYTFDGITYLGWDAAVADRTLNGLIDEVRIWNVARTAEELTSHRYQTLAGNETGLTGYWNFDDQTSGIATDLTGNGRNGTIRGGSYVLSFDRTDTDEDSIADFEDNCPAIANGDQADIDRDGIGNACDNDRDGDGIINEVDNCPDTANADQTDLDVDGVGDLCDPEVVGNFAMFLPGGNNGAISNIAIPPLNLNALPLTIEMWFKPEVQPQNFYAGLWYTRGANTLSGIYYGGNWGNRNEIRTVWNGDGGLVEPGIEPKFNEWNHVAFVVTNISKTLYVNGTPFHYNGTTFPADQFDFITYLGYDPAVANRTFRGLIDEVRIWNTAKTSEELEASKYKVLDPAREPGLKGYWNFDDRATRATDFAGNFHGTINGGRYAISTVFDPMEFVQSKASQTPAVVNNNSSGNVVMMLEVETKNYLEPLTVTALNLSATGTTALSDITDVVVYATGNNSVFSNANPVAQLNGTPGEEPVLLASNYSLVSGKNYFWITYNVSEGAVQGNKLDIICNSFTLASAEGSGVYVPTTPSPEGSLTINPEAFIDFLKLPIDTVTSEAQTSIEGANFASFQQNAIMTYNGYQYVTYWNKAVRVCIARKKLPGGEWEVLELNDHTVTPARVADSHYTISMGICKNDGTIHIAYDHHNDPLRYQRSVVGLANTPEAFAWADESFGPKQDYLVTGTQVSNVTYPRFISKPDGDLLFETRIGFSGDGDSFLWKYSAANGAWEYIGEYINGTGVSENAYINGIQYDPNGRLHVSWVWRQTPNPLTNHDVYYGYSDDDGLTWHNGDGALIGTVNTNPMTLNTAGLKVWTISTNRGLINQESQAVDSRGGIHILQSYIPDEQPASNDFWGSRINQGYLRHIYRDDTGTWRSDVIARSSRNRSQLVVDSDDNLYVVAPNYRVYFAAAATRWQTWTELDISGNNSGINEGLVDREALLQEDLLSFVFAHSDNDGKVIVPYYLVGTKRSCLNNLQLTFEIENVSCEGMTNGSARVIPNTGTAPYWYRWSDGQTVSLALNLAPGNYTVEVRDAKGCSDTKEITIGSPSALNASIAPLTVTGINTCIDEVHLVTGFGNGPHSVSLVSSTSGGNGGYTYIWSPSVGLNNPAIPNPVFTPGPETGYKKYAYSLRVVDAKGCSYTTSLTINVLNPTFIYKKEIRVCRKINNAWNCTFTLEIELVKVCYSAHTLFLPKSTVNYFLDHGACLGACEVAGRESSATARFATPDLETIYELEENAVYVSPIPTGGTFNVDVELVEAPRTPLVFSLYDYSGKLVMQESFHQKTQIGSYQFVDNELPDGLYVLEVFGNAIRMSKKVLVVKK